MLNVDRLRALHAVAAQGSILAAADALHVTTSAVSQQLAKLEREVGRPLLEKRGRGVTLTDTGRRLVAHAEQVLSMLEQAEAELEASREVVGGRLQIAAFATSVRGLAPQALLSLRQAYPHLQATLRELEPGDALPLLARRDLDLVIAQDWANAPLALPDGVVKAPLLDDVADIALPRSHRLARQAKVSLDDMVSEPWITWLEGSICHDWLMHTLRRRGHEPRVAHTASEYATQLALVDAGLGAAVIPRLGRGPVPRGVKMVEPDPMLRRHVYAVWRQDASRRAAIRAAVQAFEAAAGALTSESPSPATWRRT
ncbi:MAG TPA: LysR substrate-binding domain-containing protein [Vicinamibacterales bacterium]|nr:LysR substrate-binding domain-containing protein [Vicinamibacterales bacterium]